MQMIRKLSAAEIESILAKHFGCEKANVRVFAEKVSTGYGLGEHTEYMPVATVESYEPFEGGAAMSKRSKPTLIFRETKSGIPVKARPGAYPIGMMPLQSHVPSPASEDWELTTCPVCGRDCWYQTKNAEILKGLCPEVKFLCTECALKAKLENIPNE